MTPARFDLERNAFRVCLKFQGLKLTYSHSPVVKLRNTSQIIYTETYLAIVDETLK